MPLFGRLSAQHSGRAQPLEQHQRLLYSHTPPIPRSHQTPLVSSSDLTGTKAARWSSAGQQWPTLSSSSASSYTYYQQPSPGATSRNMATLNQQHLAGNSNSTWVTEMERKRLAELHHMQHYQEYQQQAHQHPAVFNRKVPCWQENGFPGL